MKKIISRSSLLLLLVAYVATFTSLPSLFAGGLTLDAVCVGLAAGIGAFCGIVGDKRNTEIGLCGALLSIVAIAFIIFGAENPYVRNGAVLFLVIWPSLMVIQFLRRSYTTVPENAVAIDETGRVYCTGDTYRENEIAGDPPVMVYSKPFELHIETDVICTDASAKKVSVRFKAALHPLAAKIDLAQACEKLRAETSKAVKELAFQKTLGSFLRGVKSFTPVILTGDCRFNIVNIELSLSLNQVS